MFKTVFATAAAALVAITFGASAHAGGFSGSTGANGTSMNGMSLNAITSNALGSNALHMNGTVPAASSFAIDGIELPAQVR